jgi:hypothetical protein
MRLLVGRLMVLVQEAAAHLVGRVSLSHPGFACGTE